MLNISSSKGKLTIAFLLSIVLFALCCYFYTHNNENHSIVLHTSENDITIYPWFNESNGKNYYFLPSFANADSYDTLPSDSFKVINTHDIPAVFISTESGSMESINTSKDIEEKGRIEIISPDGKNEYLGGLSSFSGRGNSTWEDFSKKPYSLKLSEDTSLLGMESGKQWYLLAMWREGSSLTTKIAMDLSQELSLAFTPDMTWVDLYLNGEYNGLYLLCESKTIEKNRIELSDESGSLLIEKDCSDYSVLEEYSFATDLGNYFSIHYPKKLSQNEYNNIVDYIMALEDSITSNAVDFNTDLDLDSFVAHFLLDEITLNIDSGVTSMYYYRNGSDSKLYAGPAWDYDSSFSNNDLYYSGIFTDYTSSILADNRPNDEVMKWYNCLMENEIFAAEVKESFADLLPYMDYLLESKIDEYYDYIEASTQMDHIRWEASTRGTFYRGIYESPEDNVRYLKYFLAHRLDYLCEQYGVSYDSFVDRYCAYDCNTTHTVTFVQDDEVTKTITVTDGETIPLSEIPPLDENVYKRWAFSYSTQKYQKTFPIFSDTTLRALPIDYE